MSASSGDSGPKDTNVSGMLEVITLFHFVDVSLDLVFVGAGHTVIAIILLQAGILQKTLRSILSVMSFMYLY